MNERVRRKRGKGVGRKEDPAVEVPEEERRRVKREQRADKKRGMVRRDKS